MPGFPPSDCFVATAGDQVLGVCGYRILRPPVAKNTLTVIARGYLEKGFATRLKTRCVDFLRQQAIKMYTSIATTQRSFNGT
jgi:hypothetical protein